MQIELKRIQQKNTVLTEEVKKDGNGEDLDLDGDVSVERYSYGSYIQFTVPVYVDLLMSLYQ